MTGWVFGYGSLLPAGAAARGRRPDGVPARLRGYRRSWGVAMDNSLHLPGYKHYRHEQTGERPSVFVAFLDVHEAPGAEVNGALLPVSEADLPWLDRRERNYERIEVSGGIRADVEGPVWTYAGLESARERRRLGLESGSLAISREYLSQVRAGFAALGAAALADFDHLTEAPPCPVAPLRVVHHS
jgi:hypothetical protein